jgi:hypothetical protein
MPFMSKPARPALVFGSIDEMIADADRLRARPYEKTGEWDLPMILDHLGKAMTLPYEGMKVPWPINFIARVMIHRMATRMKYPGFRISAPKAMKPTVGISLETAEAAFRVAAEKVKGLTGPTVSGTPFGTVPIDDYIKLHLLHGAHHLSFLAPQG